MNQIRRLLSFRIGGPHLDYLLSRWSCYLAGLALPPWVAVMLPPQARNPQDVFVGIGLALVISVLCFFMGTFSARIQLANLKSEGKREYPRTNLPLSSRYWEFAGYLIGLGILTMGTWFLSTLSLERVEMMIGLMVVLSLCLGTMGLGMLTTFLKCYPGKEIAKESLP